MKVCNVCGSSDFDSHDGHYFCSECNTKLQTIGQQQEEDEYHDNTFSQLSIASVRKKQQKSEKKELGERWSTHECFNIIICKQVEQLIKLGASLQLKLVVFYLWAKYLKKCEVAFMGSEANAEWLPRLGTVPYARDVAILYKGETKFQKAYYKEVGEVDNEESNDKGGAIEKNCVKQSDGSPSENGSDVDEFVVQEKKPKRARKLMPSKAAEKKQENDVEHCDGSVCNVPSENGSDVDESPVQGKKPKRARKLTVNEETMKKQENGIEPSGGSVYEEPSGNGSDGESPVQEKKPKKARKLMFNKEADLKQSNSASIVHRRKNRKLKNCNDFMSIEKTAAFCHLGLLLTKDNILLFDLIRWARENHFPYVSCSSLLPSTMKLQAHDWRYITAYQVPDFEVVNDQAHKLAIFLDVDDVPQRPLMPIIARFVIDMNLPNELLPFIRKLIEGKLPSLNWKTSGIPKYELMAMSIIIIALKLLFGLNDDTERKLSTIGRKLGKYLSEELQPFIWEDWMQSTMHKLNFIYHTHAPSAIFSESDLYDVNCFKAFYEKAVYHWRPRDTVLARAPYGTPEFRESLRKTFSDLSETEITPICPITSFPLTSWTSFYKNVTTDSNNLYSEDFSHYSLAYIINWKRFLQDPKFCDIYKCNLDSRILFDNCDKPLEDCLMAHNQYWIEQMTKQNPSEVPYRSFKWLLFICSQYVEISADKLYQELLKIEKLVFVSLQPKRQPRNLKKRIPCSSSVRKKKYPQRRYVTQNHTDK